MPLTDSKIRNAKPSDKLVKLTDGGGLYLEIRPTGAKLWRYRYRYRIAGKENVFASGEYAKAPSGETKEQAEARRNAGRLTPAEARIGREEWRGLVKQGIHPAHQRQAERLATHAENANTFEVVAREWVAKKKPGWMAYYLRQVERFLAADVYPYIGNLPIRNVTAAHLLEIKSRDACFHSLIRALAAS
jgi:hypothetical protein